MPRTGVPINARRNARALGMDLEVYLARLAGGEKWCGACRRWQPVAEFGRDASRGDGLTATCRVARNGHPDHDTPTNRPRGRRYAPGRDGDTKQARQRANHLVAIGILPDPNTVPCVDCRHEWIPGGPRHQMDHYLGYDAEHHDHVEVVCAPCHVAREIARGVHQSTRSTEWARDANGRFSGEAAS